MAATPVIGTGPIEFTDGSTGMQYSVPLSALSFQSGQIVSTAWSGPTGFTDTQRSVLDAYLAVLVAAGCLVPGEAPPPTAAIVFSALSPGASGNRITVTITNVRPNADASKTLFDLAIAETDKYTGLSIDPASAGYVKVLLGTETKAGSAPGLVTARDADTPKLPKNGVYPLSAGGGSAKSAAAIAANDGSGTAFTLDARGVGASGDLTKATISKADPTKDPSLFDLQVTWVQTFADLKTTTIETKLKANYLIAVSKPAAGDYGAPAPGVIVLSGGADASTATSAAGTAWTA